MKEARKEIDEASRTSTVGGCTFDQREAPTAANVSERGLSSAKCPREIEPVAGFERSVGPIKIETLLNVVEKHRS